MTGRCPQERFEQSTAHVRPQESTIWSSLSGGSEWLREGERTDSEVTSCPFGTQLHDKLALFACWADVSSKRSEERTGASGYDPGYRHPKSFDIQRSRLLLQHHTITQIYFLVSPVPGVFFKTKLT